MINFGEDITGQEVVIDPMKDNTRFLLLVGQTGSGKSYFISQLNKQLCDKYSPQQLQISLIDMKRCDFGEVRAEYRLHPIVCDTHRAFECLEAITQSRPQNIVWIHINECDMVYADRSRVETMRSPG